MCVCGGHVKMETFSWEGNRGLSLRWVLARRGLDSIF